MGTYPNMWGRVWHYAEHLALLVYCCHIALVFLWTFLGNFGWARFRHALLKCIILFANVTLLNDTVMSQHHMCIGHVTFYYKRASNTSVGVLACCSSICQVQLYHQRSMCGWCLMRVGLTHLAHLQVGAYFLQQELLCFIIYKIKKITGSTLLHIQTRKT